MIVSERQPPREQAPGVTFGLSAKLSGQMAPPIPYSQLRTLFLDVGNTLVSMNYHWILAELRKLGLDTDLAHVMRAEAASRPAVSRAVSGEASTEGHSVFSLYLRTLIEQLGWPSDQAAEAACVLVPILRGPDKNDLWSFVIEGVPEALSELSTMGLQLAVVSNSDGTVESVLERQGLRRHLSAVFDSHVVGLEKPDPRFFAHALAETGSDPETTLHLGDLYAADIVGARSAGIHAGLVDPFNDWEGVDCDRFTDVAALTKKIRANVEI